MNKYLLLRIVEAMTPYEQFFQRRNGASKLEATPI